jgi:hypothetical protein
MKYESNEVIIVNKKLFSNRQTSWMKQYHSNLCGRLTCLNITRASHGDKACLLSVINKQNLC